MNLIIVILLAIVRNVASQGRTTAVTELNASSYIGLWYQTYSNQASTESFQLNGSCITATYEVFEEINNTFTVLNYQTLGGPGGTPDIIRGLANIPNVSRIGEWLVILNCSDDCFPAPYWILDLGPINDEGLYDYAIVSDNIGLFLFVLARNVSEFNELYNDEVLIKLTQLGFVGPTQPIPTVQGPGCVYFDDNAEDATTSTSSDGDTFWTTTTVAVISTAAFIVVLGVALALVYRTQRKTYGNLPTSGRESLIEVSDQRNSRA